MEKCVENQMICTCHVDDLETAERAKLAAMVRLGAKQKRDLAIAIILSLGLEHGVKLDVAADMWFGVCGTLPDGTVHSVECDDPLDGMVFIWDIVDRARTAQAAVPIGEQCIGSKTGSNVVVLALESANAIAELRSIESAKKEHKASCSMCVGSAKMCSERRRFLEQSAAIRQRLTDSWGAPDEHTAPGFYGLCVEDVANET